MKPVITLLALLLVLGLSALVSVGIAFTEAIEDARRQGAAIVELEAAVAGAEAAVAWHMATDSAAFVYAARAGYGRTGTLTEGE